MPHTSSHASAHVGVSSGRETQAWCRRYRGLALNPSGPLLQAVAPRDNAPVPTLILSADRLHYRRNAAHRCAAPPGLNDGAWTGHRPFPVANTRQHHAQAPP